MAKGGPDFYDEASIFAIYQAKRAQPNNANETLEKPVFDALAGELKDLRILDLGCGGVQFGHEALQRGCRTYVLVTSRLALHYIEDLTAIFAPVYHTLVPGGRFIFSHGKTAHTTRND